MPKFTAEDWLRRFGPRAARILARGGPVPRDLNIEVLKRSDLSIVMRLTAGQASTIVKAFDNSVPEAREACRREVPLLMALRGRGLAPTMRGYSLEDSFFATDQVAGETVEALADKTRGAAVLSRRVGDWYAKFDTHTTRRPAQSNWLDYLTAYQALKIEDLGAKQCEFLARLPIHSQSIAKNDAHLSNFLINAEDRLIGLDFEAAAFKPVGWDILLTARTLAMQWPDSFPTNLDSLVSGWDADHPDITRNDLQAVAWLFAGLSVFRPNKCNGSRSDAYLAAFNSSAKQAAGLCALVPYTEINIVAQSVIELSRFKTHLRNIARQAARDAATTTGNRAMGRNTPTAEIPSLCAACRGKCCGEGLREHAFLKVSDIERLQNDGCAKNEEAMVEHYLSFLPDSHVEGSCVFHTKSGCSLPRSSRSDACNAYLCPSANAFSNKIKERNSSMPALFVSVEHHRPKHAVFVEGGKSTSVSVTSIE